MDHYISMGIDLSRTPKCEHIVFAPNCHYRKEPTPVSNQVLTCSWICEAAELSRRGPVHTTPLSSLWLQSVTPQPLEAHSARELSVPEQRILSSQMGPVDT